MPLNIMGVPTDLTRKFISSMHTVGIWNAVNGFLETGTQFVHKQRRWELKPRLQKNSFEFIYGKKTIYLYSCSSIDSFANVTLLLSNFRRLFRTCHFSLKVLLLRNWNKHQPPNVQDDVTILLENNTFTCVDWRSVKLPDPQNDSLISQLVK